MRMVAKDIRIGTLIMGLLVINVLITAQVHAYGLKAWALPQKPNVQKCSQWKEASLGLQKYGVALENGDILLIAQPNKSSAELSVKTTNWVKRAHLVISGKQTEPNTLFKTIDLVNTDKGEFALKLTSASVDAQITMPNGGFYISVLPGISAHWLELQADSQYALMPDFFADDIILDPTKYTSPTLSVPAENFLLHFANNGQTILMCVWQGNLGNSSSISSKSNSRKTSEPQVILRFSGKDNARKIESTRIEFQDKPIHVGILEKVNIWHDEYIATYPAYRPRKLE